MSVQVVVQTLPYLLRGTLSTVAIAAAVIVVGTAGGVALGLLRFAPWRGVGALVAWLVELVRAVPLLLLMFFIFFGLPALAIKIPTFPAAVLAMSLWMAEEDEEHRSEEHTSELQSQSNLVCRLLLEKKNKQKKRPSYCSLSDLLNRCTPAMSRNKVMSTRSTGSKSVQAGAALKIR